MSLCMAWNVMATMPCRCSSSKASKPLIHSIWLHAGHMRHQEQVYMWFCRNSPYMDARTGKTKGDRGRCKMVASSSNRASSCSSSPAIKGLDSRLSRVENAVTSHNVVYWRLHDGAHMQIETRSWIKWPWLWTAGITSYVNRWPRGLSHQKLELSSALSKFPSSFARVSWITGPRTTHWQSQTSELLYEGACM